MSGNPIVLGSESSVRDADGYPDRHSLLKAIQEVESEVAAYSVRISQINVRQAELNCKVRGTRLPEGDYRRLCQEQTDLRNEQFSLQTNSNALKIRLANLRRDLKLVEDAPEKKSMFDLGRRLDETNSILKQILIELRQQAGRTPKES